MQFGKHLMILFHQGETNRNLKVNCNWNIFSSSGILVCNWLIFWKIKLTPNYHEAIGIFWPCSRYDSTVLEVWFYRARCIFRPCSTFIELCFDCAQPYSRYVSTVLELFFGRAWRCSNYFSNLRSIQPSVFTIPFGRAPTCAQLLKSKQKRRGRSTRGSTLAFWTRFWCKRAHQRP